MPKKPPKLRPDAAEVAYRVMLEATGQAPKTRPGDEPKNPDAVERGRRGGKKGGKSRAEKLTPDQRSDRARAAADARWRKASG
jgi:hypothetical protein